MSKAWGYSDARCSGHGTMQCTACGKPITEGEYRYRQKSKGGDWGYVAQHRTCTLDDPRWAELDENRAASLEQQKALSRACREFREKWGVSELDDHIFDGDQEARNVR